MLVALSPLLAMAGDWHVSRRGPGGLVVELRDLPDTGFPEIRVRVHAPASLPAALLEAVWGFRPNGAEGRMVERRVVVEDGPLERLIWQLSRPPLVSRRETLLRLTRDCTPDGGCTLRFRSEPGAGPVSVPDAVRILLVRGLWRFTPDGQGGAFVEHSIVSDPGGDIPPWLASGPQQDIAVALVREAVSVAAR
jgi:hypothetical protein